MNIGLLGLGVLATGILCVLQVAGVISWPLIAILAPLLVAIGIVFLIILVIFILGLIAIWLDS